MIWLFFGIVCRNVPEQDTHIVPADIEDTIHIDLIPIGAVKAQVIPAYKKAVITLHVCNRGQRSARFRIRPQNTETFCDFAYRCQRRRGVQKFLLNISLDLSQIVQGLLG